MEEGHKTEVVLARHLPFISDIVNYFHRVNFTSLTDVIANVDCKLHNCNVDIADVVHKSHKHT